MLFIIIIESYKLKIAFAIFKESPIYYDVTRTKLGIKTCW